MKLTFLMLCVIPVLVAPISVSPNGNSPEIKMIGGMMVDVQKGFMPISPKQEATTAKVNLMNLKPKGNSTKLPINERYRRLIPYMTFYYANDMSTPTTESHISSTKTVEIEKAEIVEAKLQEQPNSRQPKKIVYSGYRDIPRYGGNRLTQFNKASAIPIKHYNDGPPQQTVKFTPNFNPFISDYIIPGYDRFFTNHKTSNSPYTVSTRKPYINFFNEEDTANIKYYETESDFNSKYKLVPYEQTPPVTTKPQFYSDNIQRPRKPIPVPVMIPKEHVYINARPSSRPQYYYYDTGKVEQTSGRKPTKIVPENYYEKQHQYNVELSGPAAESGFRPIPDPSLLVTGSPTYRTPEISHNSYETRKPAVQVIETQAVPPDVDDYVSNYNQYIEPTYSTPQYTPTNTLTLKDVLNSLQQTKNIPQTITKENVGSSIRTLLQVLNTLKGAPHIYDETVLLSSPKPFVSQKVIDTTGKPVTAHTPLPPVYKDAAELQQEPYLAPVDQPSQHLDEVPGGTTQQFPLPVSSDEEGGTPGQPDVDYPILTTIPHTSFDCKTQRYKGFFADPETRCQVWHYCDLNGGQASFLCPNGTIFSQAGLTCDWWFNVRCANAPQLYVLNESLYKYILPHSPKFPEDYSGPLVDRYLTLKFKEMEEQFKKNKRKMSESQEDSEEESTESSDEVPSTSTEVATSTSQATSDNPQ